MSARVRVAIWIAGLAAGIGSAMLVAETERSDHPALVVTLTLLVGWSYIAGGLVALERHPDNRFGLLMTAVGFTWFASALGNSEHDWTFTLGGMLAGSLYLAVLGHAVLSYPTGRLPDRASKVVVALAYALTTIGNAAAVIVSTPVDFDCDSCPENTLLVSHQPAAAEALQIALNLAGTALSIAAVTILYRRWRTASAPSRRTLAPVLITGAVAVGVLAMGTVLDLLLDTSLVFFAVNGVFAAIPIAFLAGLLRTGLSRSGVVAGLVHNLSRSSGSPEELRVALAQALGDRSLTIAYWLPEKAAFVDSDGVPAFDPLPATRRVTTVVEREGTRVARLEHDATLLDDIDLLNAACAAAALALENARLTTELRSRLKELSASERRMRELLEGVQLIAVSLDNRGCVLYANPYLGELTGWDRDELIGRDWLATFNADEKEFLARLRRDEILPYEESHLYTREGARRIIAWSNTVMRDVDGTVIGATSIGADITERRRAEEALRELLIEHTALERVARLVAEGRSRQMIFERVTEEAGRLLGATACDLVRFGGETGGTVLAGWGAAGMLPVPAGTHVPADGQTTADRVRRERGPVRVDDYRKLRGEVAARVRAAGIRSTVGAPITVNGELWGALTVATSQHDNFPEAAEERLGAFAGLVGLAIANAEAREQLAASRARIVAAGDAERRRLERNLHDGAQQRLVSLSLSLRLARAQISTDLRTAESTLVLAGEELAQALEELRELARGIHPAVLSDRGLRPALEALADRATLPVALMETPADRLPAQVEAAAYYVVAESLTNVAKYARAGHASVRVMRENGHAVVEVKDDGVGGADPSKGSGLRGLADRVEALDGRLAVESRQGGGTTIRAVIPCA